MDRPPRRRHADSAPRPRRRPPDAATAATARPESPARLDRQQGGKVVHGDDVHRSLTAPQPPDGALPVGDGVADRQHVALRVHVAGDVRDDTEAAPRGVQVGVGEERGHRPGHQHGVDEDVVAPEGGPVQHPCLREIPADRADPGGLQRVARSPAAAAQRPDHQRVAAAGAGPEKGVPARPVQRAQRCFEHPAPVQYGERRAQVAGPVAERGQPAAAGVHQVLQVQQRAAARREPAEQFPGARLALVGVAEVEVPVAQRTRFGGQLLQPQDVVVPGRLGPAARRRRGAARADVPVEREGPLGDSSTVMPTPWRTRRAASSGTSGARRSVARLSCRSHRWGGAGISGAPLHWAVPRWGDRHGRHVVRPGSRRWRGAAHRCCPRRCAGSGSAGRGVP